MTLKEKGQVPPLSRSHKPTSKANPSWKGRHGLLVVILCHRGSQKTFRSLGFQDALSGRGAGVGVCPPCVPKICAVLPGFAWVMRELGAADPRTCSEGHAANTSAGACSEAPGRS